MASDTLTIIINAKDNASGPLSKVNKKLGGMGKIAGIAGKAVAGGLAVAGVAALGFGAKAVSMGSDVEEMMGKFNVVFGDSAQKVTAALDDFGAAVGRNKFDLRGMAASIQDTFVPMGFARDKAADLSVQLTELAVDVASFNNASDADVMRDFQSALVGNTETVRKYGIVITQSSLNQELLNMGVEGGIKNATEAQKVQARLNIIMAGTADAQGDAARTAGSWANTMRGLKASLAETTAEIGLKLLPVFTPMLQSLADLAQKYGPMAADAVGRFIEQVVAFIGVLQTGNVGDIAAALGFSPEAVAWIKNAAETITSVVTSAYQTISDAIAAFQGGGDVGDIASALGFSDDAIAKVDDFVAVIQDGWGQVMDFLAPTFERLQEAVGPMLESFGPLGEKLGPLGEAFGALGEAIKPVAVLIGGVLVAAFDLLLEVVAAVMPDLGSIVGNVVDGITIFINTLAAVITDVVTLVQDLIAGDLDAAWNDALNIVTDLTDGIIGIIGAWFDAVATIFGDLVTGVSEWLGNMDGEAKARFDEFIAAATVWATDFLSSVQQMLNDVLAAVRGFSLRDAGRALMQGMIDGIKSMAGALVAAATGVVQNAIDAAKNLLHIHSPSQVFIEIGEDTILGLIKGIEGMDDDAAKAMASVVNSVIRAAKGLLDFAFDLAEFEIPDNNYQDAIDWLASLAGRLSQAVTSLQGWKIDFGDDFKAFAANLKAGFAPLLEALKFVEKMQSFKWLKPGTGVPIIKWLASFAGYVAKEMARIGSWKNIDFGDAFKEFSDNLKKGFGPLIEALKLVEKMQSFQWLKPGTAVPVIKWLASFSGIMAQEMTRISKWGGIDFGEGFKRFTDGIKEGFGAMSDALKFTEELGMWKHAKGLRGKFTQFRKDWEFIIQEFGKSARKLKGMVDDDMAQFAKTMSDIAGGLIDAVELLKTDWTKVTVPPASLWAPLFDWIMQVMTEAARYATEEIKPEALDAASKFGGAIGALIGGLSDALSFITDLMQTPGSVFGDADKFADAMGMLLQRIDGTIKAFKTYIVDKEGDEWLDAADAFLNVLNEVIGTLSSALRLFTDLGSADMPSLSEIDQFVSAIIAIFAQLGESVTQSAGMIRVAVGDIKTQLGGGHMEGGMHAVAFNSTITVRHDVSVTSPDGSVGQIDMETLANELKDYIGYGY